MKVSSENEEKITQLWHLNGKCEEGTIPVRRTRKSDVMRASSVKNYGKKNSVSTVAHPNSIDLDLINQSGHQVSYLYNSIRKTDDLVDLLCLNIRVCFLLNVDGVMFDFGVHLACNCIC